MHDDNEEAVAEVSTAGGDAPLVSREPVLDANALIRFTALLRERIPGFQCLTVAEEQSMLRASNLDPEFIEAALMTAAVWAQAAAHTGLTDEQMRELDAQIRESDRAEQEFQVLLRGLSGANRKRRWRLGRAALVLYKSLSIELRYPTAANSHLLPYFERMKRAYMKNRKTRGKAVKKDEGAG